MSSTSKRKNNINGSDGRRKKRRKTFDSDDESSDASEQESSTEDELASSEDEEWFKNKRIPKYTGVKTRSMYKKYNTLLINDSELPLVDEPDESDLNEDYLNYIEKKIL